MTQSQEWNVTVRGRIEGVTDLDSFPEMLRSALAAASTVSVVRFDPPTWPHTTVVVIRVTAKRKKVAQKLAYDVMLPIFTTIAYSVLGEQKFGWTIGVDAIVVS
jgi:hypothetical protein